MNNIECAFEHRILKAIKLQTWTNDLRNHVTGCRLCQETMAVAALMEQISHEQIQSKLPSYRLIWLKAQYARKQERLSKLDIVSMIGLSVIGIAVLIGALFWRFPKLFAGVLGTSANTVLSLPAMFSSAVPVAVFIGVILMVLLVTRDSLFTER